MSHISPRVLLPIITPSPPTDGARHRGTPAAESSARDNVLPPPRQSLCPVLDGIFSKEGNDHVNKATRQCNKMPREYSDA